MFAGGLHVPSVSIVSYSIVQPHSLNGHLITNRLDHKISAAPYVPYVPEASHVHMLKGYKGILPLW